MNLKNLSFLLVIMLGAKLGIAQEDIPLKSRTALPKSNKKIIATYLSKSSDNFLQLFEGESRTSKIQTGVYAGLNHREMNQGFILPNGAEFRFRKNEGIVAFENEYFLTKIVDYERGNTELSIYEVANGSLQLLGRKTHHLIEGSHHLMDNGLVIISDESEDFGTSIELYTKNYEKLNSYTPFQNGFSRGLFANNDKVIVGVFKSDSDETVKIVFFSSFTGKVLNERIIQLSTSLQLLKSANEYFLIYGSGILTCLNLSGEILWDRPFVLPNFDIYNNGGNVFLFTKAELISLTTRSGNINWRQDLKRLSNISSIPLASQAIRPTAVRVGENSIDVIFSLTRKGTLTHSDKRLNNQFVRLNINGDIEARISLSKESNDLKIGRSVTGIAIIQDQEILKYER